MLSGVVFFEIVRRVNAGATRYTLHVFGSQASALLALAQIKRHKKRSQRASEHFKDEILLVGLPN